MQRVSNGPDSLLFGSHRFIDANAGRPGVRLDLGAGRRVEFVFAALDEDYFAEGGLAGMVFTELLGLLVAK